MITPDAAESDRSERYSPAETSPDDDTKSDTTDAQSDTTECLNLQLCEYNSFTIMLADLIPAGNLYKTKNMQLATNYYLKAENYFCNFYWVCV